MRDWLLIPVSLLLIAGACTDATAPQAELRAARTRWASWGPAAYRLTIMRSCECTSMLTGPVLVTVDRPRNEESRVYTATGAPVPDSYAHAFPAVEGLFNLIQGLIDEGAHSVHVEYDPILGFPRAISVDQYPGVVDDEFTYRITLSPP